MIKSYLFHVNSEEALPPARAYAFYSCLLSLLPEEYVEQLHEQRETPISQCLYKEKTDTLWRISLLDDTADSVVSPILSSLDSLSLAIGRIDLDKLQEKAFSAEELIGTARAIESDRYFSLCFLSPTAFKQGGRYTVLPEKELILQSLMKKWNAAFPSYPLEDADAFQMLAEGIRISDFNLRTTRFSLKDNKIPGFIGTMSLDTHLSAPLLELWKLWISFAPYSGLGIKTALGMGGIKLFTT